MHTMKLRTVRLLIIVVVFCTVTETVARVVEGTSTFTPRSQSTNLARDLAGVYRYRTRQDDTTSYGYLTATATHARSLRPKRIADSLFGFDTLVITGSMVENRGSEDLLADYFGLSPAFQSVVRFAPHIHSTLLVFNGFIPLDRIVEGLYLEIVAPFGQTFWKMGLDEEVIETGIDTPFPALYMADQAVTAPITQFTQAMTTNVTFGQMQDPVSFGKIARDGLAHHGASDILWALGWYCVRNDHGQFGINLRGAFPAGNRPNGDFFFAPVLGNGKHYELGCGFDGYVTVWEKDGTQQGCVCVAANVTHLFNTRQRRSFDLIENKPLSRYMLIKEFDAEGNYSSHLSSVINHTTLPCTVHIDIKTDILIMFEYTHHGAVADIGYNGYIQSKEKIALCAGIPSRLFGAKGIQNVAIDQDGVISPSNVTQSEATIFGNEFDEQELVADPQSPVFISSCDIDVDSAATTRIITHKLFAHLGYAWQDRVLHGRHAEPLVGFGAEIEFEGINPRNRTQPVHDTLAQWSIWFKLGCAF